MVRKAGTTTKKAPAKKPAKPFDAYEGEGGEFVKVKHLRSHVGEKGVHYVTGGTSIRRLEHAKELSAGPNPIVEIVGKPLVRTGRA